MHGVFLDLDTLHPQDLDLTPLHQALPGCQLFARTPAELTRERIQEADVVISNKVVLDPSNLTDSVKLIAIAATGYNNIDLDTCRARGIAVCNARGYGTASVVQTALAMLLTLCNRIRENDQLSKNGAWQQADQFCLLDYPPMELTGRTLGIIGYGTLGQAMARLATALGMRVLLAQRDAADTRPDRLPLSELLRQIDVLSLHCPLTEANFHLIGARELALLKPGAIVLNTARGGLVDEQALADALRSGRLGGAGVDVLSTEPPTAGNPLLAPELHNLLITPHMSWSSQASRQRLLNQVASNISAWRRGESVNRLA